MVTLSLTLLFGVIGWVVAHLLTHRRSVIADRRKVTIDYRISAYRNLNHFACRCVSRAAAIEDMVKEFNSAIADIQLFGCPSEIVLAQKLAKAISSTRKNDPNTLRELLLDLLCIFERNFRLLTTATFLLNQSFSLPNLEVLNKSINQSHYQIK